jgi:chromosome segregation ATPase
MRSRKGKWKCTACNKQKLEKDSSVECNLCNDSVGIECSDFNQEVFDYLKDKKVEVTFICKSCKETLPDLRNMLEITRQITKQQHKLRDDVDAHDTRITKCEVDLSEVTEKQNADNQLLKEINTRLGDLEAKVISSETVETIATKCFKKADFPSIKEVERQVREQSATNKKLEETLETHLKSLQFY